MGKPNITSLLNQWHLGDPNALNQVVSLVHDELHRIARGRLAAWDHRISLVDPTVLVHETYLRLVGYRPREEKAWSHKGEFFSLVATMMLHILMDYQKRKRAKKHGGANIKVTLEDDMGTGRSEWDLMALEEVLAQLERLDARQGKIWKCRYLCGLSIDELVQAFALSPATLHREIKAANGWIHYRLGV